MQQQSIRIWQLQSIRHQISWNINFLRLQDKKKVCGNFYDLIWKNFQCLFHTTVKQRLSKSDSKYYSSIEWLHSMFNAELWFQCQLLNSMKDFWSASHLRMKCFS